MSRPSSAGEQGSRSGAARRPSLSVVMPNYNHASFLPQSLGAILGQGRRPDEVIVVDDGSTDESLDVLRRIAAQDDAVKVIENDRNRGVAYSVNRGLRIAAGDYVLCASADDLALPGLFERSMALLEDHPGAGLCCSQPALLDGDRGEVTSGSAILAEPGYWPPAAVEDLLRRGFWIAGHTAVIKTQALRDAGGLREDLRWHCDWFAMLVIAFRHGLCYVPEPLAALRVRPSSYSARAATDQAAQLAVIGEVRRLLRSAEYADVRSYFRGSGAISAALLPKLGAAAALRLARPDYWPVVPPGRVLHDLGARLFRQAREGAPPGLRRAYRSLRGRPPADAST